MLQHDINRQTVYIFASLFIKSNMYIILCGDQALVVDPHISTEALQFLLDKKISHITIFLTHEHPDHTCGIPMLKEHFSIMLICQKNCADIIKNKAYNRPALMCFVLGQEDKKNGTHTAIEFQKNFPVYCYDADVTFDDTFTFLWQGASFFFKATPGHSPGSSCIVWDNAVFTGDSLILDNPVITRFVGGSAEDYRLKTYPFLRLLSPETVILPGHGKIFRKFEYGGPNVEL